jgi:phosphatidylglycerophosphate synthase
MKHNKYQPINELAKTISQERGRTNILEGIEQKIIAFLVQRVPSWISSDMLTAIGFFGSLIIFLSFILAAYIKEVYLLLGVLGYMINWFGDSLDGRTAYFRNRPRKWYGFSLDLITDWIGIILMGWGFLIYANGIWEIIGYIFVVLYGWEMIITLLRYKITGKYSIDSGLMGPTEARVIISGILILEVIIKDSILYSSAMICTILFIVNILDTIKLLKLADVRDKEEKKKKIDEENA